MNYVISPMTDLTAALEAVASIVRRELYCEISLVMDTDEPQVANVRCLGIAGREFAFTSIPNGHVSL